MIRDKKKSYNAAVVTSLPPNIRDSGIFWRQLRKVNTKLPMFCSVTCNKIEHFRDILSTPNSSRIQTIDHSSINAVQDEVILNGMITQEEVIWEISTL